MSKLQYQIVPAQSAAGRGFLQPRGAQATQEAGGEQERGGDCEDEDDGEQRLPRGEGTVVRCAQGAGGEDEGDGGAGERDTGGLGRHHGPGELHLAGVDILRLQGRPGALMEGGAVAARPRVASKTS